MIAVCRRNGEIFSGISVYGEVLMGEELGVLRRTHHCGELRREHASRQVVLMGWVHRRRDHGGLIFIDLGDRVGMVQIGFNAQVVAYNEAETSRSGDYMFISTDRTVLERCRW